MEEELVCVQIDEEVPRSTILIENSDLGSSIAPDVEEFGKL